MEDQRTLGKKAEVFWPIEKTGGLGKDQVDGTKERGGPIRQWEKGHTRCFRYVTNRRMKDWHLK